MAHRKWKDGDKVHLAENPKYSGTIAYISSSEIVGDDLRYYVKWAGQSTEILYYGNALISPKEAEEILPKSKLETVKDVAKDVIKVVKETLTTKKEGV